MYRLLLLGTLVCSNGFAANACKKLEQKQVTRALKAIEKADIFDYTVIDQYCEACLDDYPQPVVVENYRVKANGEAYSLYINGRAINLSYFYAGGVNLAQVAGCKTIAVSKYLD